MKNLLLITIALISLSFSVNAQSQREAKIVSSEYVKQSMSASNTIFECQCIINTIMTKEGVKSYEMQRVADILGAEKFARFQAAILHINGKGLVFKNLVGENEAGSGSIMTLKYGKRFRELATYVKVVYATPKKVTFVDGTVGMIEYEKRLVSYSERVAK